MASRVITVLKSYVVCLTWYSYNGNEWQGPPFNRESFHEFSDEWDFNHITSSSHHEHGQVAPPWKLFSNHLIRERCILVVDWSNIAQTSQSKSLFRAGATFLMNAVNTDKSLLKKARDDKHDPLLSILEWRNTQTEGVGKKSKRDILIDSLRPWKG